MQHKTIAFIADTIKSVRRRNPTTEPGIDAVAWAFADELFPGEDASQVEARDRFFSQTVEGVSRRNRA